MDSLKQLMALAVLAAVASLVRGFVVDTDPSQPQFSCATSKYGEYCKLPFVYKGVKYYRCDSVKSLSQPGETHCPLAVNSNLEGSDMVTCMPDSCVLDCTTTQNQRCVFPFKHGGKTFYFCSKEIKADGQMWCATSVDATGEATGFGLCDMSACVI